VDAYVQVWWPGTEGLGMTDILFGDYDFTGKTAFPWYWYPEWLGFNNDPSKPYMFNIGAGLKKSEEFNDATPIPVKPSGDLRQGAAIVVEPSGTRIDSRIYTLNARQSYPVNEPNLNAEPFKPTYYQPVYGKGGLMASTQIILPTAPNWCGDTWVEYKLNVLKAGTYNVGLTRTGSGSSAVEGAVRVLINGEEKASYAMANIAAGKAIDLEAGEQIMRLAFSTSAAGVTFSSINIGERAPEFILDVNTLVAGYNANVGISGATDGTRVDLRRGADVVLSANLVNGAARFFVSKEDAIAGNYSVIVYNGDEFVGSRSLTIIPLPENVWSMAVGTESNMILAKFNTEIALYADRFSITIDGDSYGGTLQADQKTIILADANAGEYENGDIVAISGVLLPNLFPSYSFTFNGALVKV